MNYLFTLMILSLQKYIHAYTKCSQQITDENSMSDDDYQEQNYLR